MPGRAEVDSLDVLLGSNNAKKNYQKKRTTLGIRWSSPTQLLIQPFRVYLGESGRDPEFSWRCGRTWRRSVRVWHITAYRIAAVVEGCWVEVNNDYSYPPYPFRIRHHPIPPSMSFGRSLPHLRALFAFGPSYGLHTLEARLLRRHPNVHPSAPPGPPAPRNEEPFVQAP